jgi:hypothetical protein
MGESKLRLVYGEVIPDHACWQWEASVSKLDCKQPDWIGCCNGQGSGLLQLGLVNPCQVSWHEAATGTQLKAQHGCIIPNTHASFTTTAVG